ncbi:MAG: hypothetical protein JWO67_881 [Streptosporangiaceae bacterium]|nr:hypothetical protein [Streptosporangiaceae bacterium]
MRRLTPGARTIVKVGISAVLLALLVVEAGPGRLADALLRLDVRWVAAGLVAGAAAAVLQANQLRGLLVAFGVPLRLGPVLRFDTAARLFDAVLPTNIGGDVVRLTLFGRRPGTRVGATVAVLVRRVVSIPGLVLLVGIGCALSISRPYAGKATALGLCCLGGGLLIVFLMATAGRVDWSSLSWVPGPARKLTRAVLQARATGVGPSMPIVRAGLRGLAFWATVVVSQTCYIWAAGIHPPLGYAILVVTCVNAVSMVPISLGGYGLREGAFSVLLSVGGLGTASQGASVGICLSVQTLLFGLLGGLIYLQLSTSVRRPSVPVPTPAAGAVAAVSTKECVPCPEF